MPHESQDCPTKQLTGIPHTALRENLFDRVSTPMQREGSSRGKEERTKEEASYKPNREDRSYVSRVQRSSHSSRMNPVNNCRDSRYKPYSNGRYVEILDKKNMNKDQVWKEKQQPLIDK